ncbi:MAG: right-handed parallel beta-helix repeat-containing protein, partial [Planctomycetota bacterium]|nr:right-handed parallel beta-helix repeat-containing protein [Planctomycetota bacterium]
MIGDGIGVDAIRCDFDDPMEGANITIRNGAIRNWANRGFNGDLSASARISGLTVAECERGITAGIASIIEDCTVVLVDEIGISAGVASVIRRCTVIQGADIGIFMITSGVISECVATNSGVGFDLYGAVAIHDSIADFNTTGIRHDGPAGLIKNCIVNNSTETGIQVDNNVRIEGCTIRSCLVDGIEAETSNHIVNNLIADMQTQGAIGICANGESNHISGNHIVDCSNAMNLNASRNFAVQNTISGMGGVISANANNFVGPFLTATQLNMGQTNPHANFFH